MKSLHTPVAPGYYLLAALPKSTPWGPHDSFDVLMWGKNQQGHLVPIMWQVYCPGHGGTRLSRDLAAKWLKRLPAECHKHGGSIMWYEEDCESAVPLFIFYNALDPRCWLVAQGQAYPRHKLLDSIKRWMPRAVPAVLAIAREFDNAFTGLGGVVREELPATDEVAQ